MNKSEIAEKAARESFDKASRGYHEFRRQLREKTTRQGTPEEQEYLSLQIDWNEYANVKAWQFVERAIAESQAPQPEETKMSELPTPDPNEQRPPQPADAPNYSTNFAPIYIAEQIFFHVLLKGGEGNPFRGIKSQWFAELAAPKIRELLTPELGDGEPSPPPSKHHEHCSAYPNTPLGSEGCSCLKLKENLCVSDVNESGCDRTKNLVDAPAVECTTNGSKKINKLESGAAQEVSHSANYVSEIRPRPDDPSCHVCGAQMVVKEWKCLSCKATTGVEEVSPPSPVLGLCDTPHNLGDRSPDEKSLIQSAHQHNGNSCKNWRAVNTNRGDTLELKAALQAIIDGSFAAGEMAAEGMSSPCHICRPSDEHRHEEGCPILQAERLLGNEGL